MLNWYAVYVNVKHEKKVVKKLQEQNIEAYSPIVKRIQQWSDRKKTVEFPMLSGYVFVKIDLQNKEKVLHSPGVFSFIKFNGVEAKIRDVEIGVLKSIEMSGYDVTQEVEEMTILDNVEVTQGALKGLKGTIVQMNNTNYVQIVLESINQSVKVKLPQHILKKRIILHS